MPVPAGDAHVPPARRRGAVRATCSGTLSDHLTRTRTRLTAWIPLVAASYAHRRALATTRSLLFLYGAAGHRQKRPSRTPWQRWLGDLCWTLSSAERLVGDGSQHRQWLARLDRCAAWCAATSCQGTAAPVGVPRTCYATGERGDGLEANRHAGQGSVRLFGPQATAAADRQFEAPSAPTDFRDMAPAANRASATAHPGARWTTGLKDRGCANRSTWRRCVVVGADRTDRATASARRNRLYLP